MREKLNMLNLDNTTNSYVQTGGDISDVLGALTRGGWSVFCVRKYQILTFQTHYNKL